MLLGDMNISRIMTHAHRDEGDNHREHVKENKMSRTLNYEYYYYKFHGGNLSQSQQKFSALAPSSFSAPSSKNKYDQKGKTSRS